MRGKRHFSETSPGVADFIENVKFFTIWDSPAPGSQPVAGTRHCTQACYKDCLTLLIMITPCRNCTCTRMQQFLQLMEQLRYALTV